MLKTLKNFIITKRFIYYGPEGGYLNALAYLSNIERLDNESDFAFRKRIDSILRRRERGNKLIKHAFKDCTKRN